MLMKLEKKRKDYVCKIICFQIEIYSFIYFDGQDPQGMKSYSAIFKYFGYLL